MALFLREKGFMDITKVFALDGVIVACGKLTILAFYTHFQVLGAPVLV